MLSFAKPLLLWIFVCTFLLLIILRVSGTLPWNWFLVFTPMWILDFVALLSLMVCMFHRSVRLRCVCDLGTRLDRFLSVCVILCKLIAQTAICLFAEHLNRQTTGEPLWIPVHRIRLVYIMIPCWTTLLLLLGSLYRNLVDRNIRRAWSFCGQYQIISPTMTSAPRSS
ncbi:hypothetical protein CSKR_203624 [Clonorchis sinensis]|uniref:Transmembrane protein 60 n=1 Tax=Clonorchis sinensis TaxID=79923 RepID=A0A8T1MUT6_CLOSI|nr:hypothetical protein CSKR_203624 [Clonorchis sinensis]